MRNRNTVYFIFKEIFYALGLGLGIFLIMELIRPRIVLGYINLSIWLVFWLLSGIIVLIVSYKKNN